MLFSTSFSVQEFSGTAAKAHYLSTRMESVVLVCWYAIRVKRMAGLM